MLMLHELLSIIKPPGAFKQQAVRKLGRVTNGSMRGIAGQIPGKAAVPWCKRHHPPGISTLQYLQMRENIEKAYVSAKCLPLEMQELPLVPSKPIVFQL